MAFRTTKVCRAFRVSEETRSGGGRKVHSRVRAEGRQSPRVAVARWRPGATGRRKHTPYLACAQRRGGKVESAGWVNRAAGVRRRRSAAGANIPAPRPNEK